MCSLCSLSLNPLFPCVVWSKKQTGCCCCLPHLPNWGDRKASKKKEGWNYRVGDETVFEVIQSDVLDDQVILAAVPWLMVDYWPGLEDLLGIFKKKKSSKCSNSNPSVRFLDELVRCVIHNLVNLYVICFSESDIYFLGIVSDTMMQIKFLKTFASEGS